MVFASWGYYDQRQITRVCKRFGLLYPFAVDAHISLKHEHATFYELERPMGMDGALRYHGLSLVGTHHRGLDDARNISQIAACMLTDGWTHPLLG
jgi:inhibitor of KinA sporulation pathway (predicted exonuclease)